MFRTLTTLVATAFAVVTLGVAAPAHAQELMATNIAASSVLFPVMPLVPAPVATVVATRTEAAAPVAQQEATFTRASFDNARRPSLLPALYISQIALQALDAHSTYSAINRGGVEANPLMKGVVNNKGAMMAVKVGVAASTIWIAERMWKRGNRAGAIATMLLVNGVTAAVVANNYKVASSLR